MANRIQKKDRKAGETIRDLRTNVENLKQENTGLKTRVAELEKLCGEGEVHEMNLALAQARIEELVAAAEVSSRTYQNMSTLIASQKETE